MRTTLLRLLILLVGLASGAAFAQDAQRCMEIEQQLGTRPLQMLAFLDHAECLGGARDTDPVTVAVRRLLPVSSVATDQLGEVPHAARAALDQVASYVNSSMPAQDPSARALIAQIAEAIDTVRAKLAQHQPLGELDARGWGWRGDSSTLAGLPTLPVASLNVSCSAPTDEPCRKAAATGKVVFRAAALVRQSLQFSLAETYQQALVAARLRDKKWGSYFDEARLQYPWELVLNGWRHRDEGRKTGGFADVPRDQWILLHPGVGLEHVRNAPKGNRFEPALIVEMIGYNRWSWSENGRMGTAYGVSLIQSYSDRAGLSSARPGIMFHYNNKYSLALTRKDGEMGLMLSMDLSKLLTKVDEEVRTKFRLQGGGRDEDRILGAPDSQRPAAPPALP